MAPEVTFFILQLANWSIYLLMVTHVFPLVDYKYLEARDTLLLLPPPFLFFHLLGTQKLDEIAFDF